MDTFNWRKMSCAVLMVGAAVTGLEAQSFTTLAAFNGTNGALPNTFIQGADGNFYGTTEVGGMGNAGTFFKMTPAGTLTTMYNFYYQGLAAVSLMQGSEGNFYGTAVSAIANPNGPMGTIFKMTPGGTFTTLYQFTTSGGFPYGALIQGTDGNFYGATDALYGPPGLFTGSDTIYQMTPQGAVTILYTFPISRNTSVRL
jgi:uncharacterized repeat protein (TIGR03803 family)